MQLQRTAWNVSVEQRSMRILHINRVREQHVNPDFFTSETVSQRKWSKFHLKIPACESTIKSVTNTFLMQFSVATRESRTLHCVLLDCNGTKWTGNTLIIPAAASSQQLLRRNKLPTGCYFLFFFALFTPWHECICDRFDCRQCCDSHAGIFKWNFYFISEIMCPMSSNLN